MTHHVSPADLGAYTTALALPLADKLFFVGHIPDDVTVFVDFGCADGLLLWETMKQRFGRPGAGSSHYIGYDRDPAMIAAADKRVCFDPAFTFVANLEATQRTLDGFHKEGRKSCLILSSVMHEVLSQAGVTFRSFWDIVQALDCDYVVIRDMALERSAMLERTPAAWYGSAFVREDAMDIARAMSFEQTHGQITDRHNFIHFLLKAVHPVEDWAKELEENYLPLCAEQYLNLTTVGSGYRLKHYAHTPCRELQDLWSQQFGIYVPDPTHVKLVLKKGW